MTVSKELSKHKLDLVRVQESRWDRGGAKPADKRTILYAKENENHELGTGFFMHKEIISAVEMVEVVGGRTSHVILRGRWCLIIVLNVHAPTD
jgi:hypothetical protein